MLIPDVSPLLYPRVPREQPAFDPANEEYRLLEAHKRNGAGVIHSLGCFDWKCKWVREEAR